LYEDTFVNVFSFSKIVSKERKKGKRERKKRKKKGKPGVEKSKGFLSPPPLLILVQPRTRKKKANLQYISQTVPEATPALGSVWQNITLNRPRKLRNSYIGVIYMLVFGCYECISGTDVAFEKWD